ncbi:WD40 repeat-like protein [Microthyrium microscopicum]|uniref:WD40 repeat-like protein n=1 Tax=Microthyrium microscopicum TaxID=703497 RepID=A0A6A6US15_9PEZI|nr:WD40 repeat-like protein [Microthyrium microscopicum]
MSAAPGTSNSQSASSVGARATSSEPGTASLYETDDDMDIDEDDPDYVPLRNQRDVDYVTDESDDEYEEAPDSGNDEEYFDLDDADAGEIELLTEIIQEEIAGEGSDSDEDEEEESDSDEEVPAATTHTTPLLLSRNQLLRLINTVGVGGSFRRTLGTLQRGVVQDDDDEEEHRYLYSRRRPRREAPPLEPVPNPVGRDLVESGTFGHPERRQSRINQTKKHARRILDRELGSTGWGREKVNSSLLKQNFYPEDPADMIIQYPQRCYSGQFSADGTFFFSCSQDFKVRMYDTSNPYDWKYYKSLDMPYGQWTLTDASLSPDNRHLVYSSMTHMVCLASVDRDAESTPQPLDLSRFGSGVPRRHRDYGRWFSVYSVRFSGDGREIVAGTGDNSVYVFDIERNQSILQIQAHHDDVNAVCYGDSTSPHILYSGSDDCTVKVWDRRSLSDGRPAGVFLGHVEGVTYVDSKDDGRHLLSNSKDQTCKLWDIRKCTSPESARSVDSTAYSQSWDYRSGDYDLTNWQPHPKDSSLVTFRGHRVERTLIRCHFAPQGSADGRYVYSGSQDGKVYVWNMDATLAKTIDVGKATEFLKDREDDDDDHSYHWGGGYHTVIRDVSWHPNVPMIAATAWNGWGSSMGTCTVHSWNDGLEEDEGFDQKGRRVDPQLNPDNGEAPPTRRTRRRRAY